MVNRNRIFSVIVWWVIGYQGIGNLIILDENVNADNYVRTLSNNLFDSVENIFGDRNYSFVFRHDIDAAHTARRMVKARGHIHHSMASQSMDLNIVEQVWDFMGREIVRVMPVRGNGLIGALHNYWLKITVPYLHNFYNFLPRRVKVVIGGRGYTKKILINKVFSQKGQYLNMSHFSWKKYSFVANYADKIALLIFDGKHFPGVASLFIFLSGECTHWWMQTLH